MFQHLFNGNGKYDITLEKYLLNDDKKENVSKYGAFSSSDTVRFVLKFERTLGAYLSVIRFSFDNNETKDLPMSFLKQDNGFDYYFIDISSSILYGQEIEGICFYEFLILRQDRTLFVGSVNNYDISVSKETKNKFSLLFYKQNFETPSWLKQGTMYHIFVDRFAKGSKNTKRREDAIINNDWYDGVPQFQNKPGEDLKNNMFFGGDLFGVAEKMDYLKSIGVTTIYLSPIFKAYSNHKYDTGDYSEIDEMFGGEEALIKLIEVAKKNNIKIILDGVFNHTGDNSLYFNKYGEYNSVGAYQSKESKYYSWFNFESFPDKYDCWWGIKILPKLNQTNKECRDYFVGKGGIIEKYLKMGVNGFRLDVADELPNVFIDELRNTIKTNSKNQSAVIGEVWENAVTKISYGQRRKYFQGAQLDSVMNYPLRNGIIDFLKNGDSTLLYNTLIELYSSYPRQVSDSLMNILGTHDTERILSVLSFKNVDGLSNKDFSKLKMSEKERKFAKENLKLAALIQYTVFGFPSLFYGDEAGIEGYGDPFCRKTYPWGKEDKDILELYEKLGNIRLKESAYKAGEFEIINHSDGIFAFSRESKNSKCITIINKSKNDYKFSFAGQALDLLSGKKFKNELQIKSNDGTILKF